MDFPVLPDKVSSDPNLSFGHTDPPSQSLDKYPCDQILSQMTSRPILYPMKESRHRPTTQAGDAPIDVCEDLKWIGLAPLDMIQNIVLLAQGSEAFNTVSESNCQLAFGRSLLQGYFIDPRAGQKRKRGHNEDDGSDEEMRGENSIDALIGDPVDAQHPDCVLNKWKPSSTLAKLPTCLDSLIKKIELLAAKHPTQTWFLPSYNRVQQSFFSKVMGGNPGNISLAVRLATSQMRVLTGMVSMDEHKARAITSVQFPGSNSMRMKTNTSKKTKPSGTKERFQFFMTLWIKNNWQNPFPDWTMIVHLANHMIQNGCVDITRRDSKVLIGLSPIEYQRVMVDIAIEKITNWLVNTRTRKWRPSIAQAFDKKRPATMLFEDSLRIYEGKDLSQLHDSWDSDTVFSFDEKYSLPLSSWKKKGRTYNGKIAKARTQRFSNKEKSGANRSREMMETSFDLSPCSEFLRAGGYQMFLEEEDETMVDGIVGGSFAAI